MTLDQMLRISKDLSLPLAAVTEPLAVVARRGRGKTYAGLKLKEEMQKAGQKTAAIDPLDVWYGIRSSADGRGEGFPVVIFGGDHADVDLTPNMGREVADFLVNEPLSIIVVPDFETNQDTVEFMTAFLDRLLKANRDPLHLFFDEAEAFAPERPAKYEARMLGAMGRLVKRGRVRGLGATLITQRTASLNKNVLSQVGGLFIMALSSPWDRAPVERWMATNGTPEQMEGLKDDLASLPLGEGYFWHPDWDIFQRIKISQRQTFDSSATPEVGQKRIVPKTLAEVDVPKVTERFRAQVERRKADDPAEIRKLLAEEKRRCIVLEKELAERPAEPRDVEVIKTVDVPVLSKADLGRLEKIVERLVTTTEGAAAIAASVRESIDEAIKSQQEVAVLVNGKQVASVPLRPSPVRTPSSPVPTKRSLEKAADNIDADFTPSSSQQRILNALAWAEAIGRDDVHKIQLALFAEQSPKSSGYSNNLGALRTAGLISYPSKGRVALTNGGRAVAEVTDTPTTNEEMWESIYSRVGKAKARILQVLIESYPNPISKQDLAERAEQSPSSSGFSNNLGSLRSLGLIDYPQPGHVVALPALFLSEAA